MKKISLNLLNEYIKAYQTPSDINEHINTFNFYASQSNSVVECGVRSVVASYGFLFGLATKENTSYTGVDLIKSSNVDYLKNIAIENNINFNFIEGNDIEVDLPKADIYFIDTWHIYGHLKRELEKIKNLVNKWIILHDTTIDGIYGETIRCGWNAEEQSIKTGIPVNEINKGLWPAIEEFLENNTNYILEHRFENNNGLTILKKIQTPKLLVLVISGSSENTNDYEHYRNLKISWQEQKPENDIDIFYVETKNNILFPYMENNTLYIPYVGETIIPGIIYKTIEAFKYFQNHNYDFVLRTNLSSLYNWKNFKILLNKLPKTNLYAGYMGKELNIKFASGAGYIISKDICQLILNNIDKIDINLMDDVAIGNFMQIFNIQSYPLNRYDIYHKESCKYNIEEIHYRIKLEKNREDELLIRKYLLTNIEN